MTSKDPYEILGVSRQATPEEIKRAYRQLAKQYHPDRNPNDKSAEQRFKEVQAANEILSDPQRRAQYDRFGAGGPMPEYQQWAAGGGTPFDGAGMDFGSLGDLTSIFEQFFHRGGPSSRGRHATRKPQPRGASIEYPVELAFEESINGTTRQVVLSSRARGGPSERIEVRIPAGVRDGQLIRVKGKGQDALGGRGDLMIRCKIQPHPLFRRDELDILIDLPLTFAEATLGAKINLPTPRGPAIVSVPPGTAGGTKLRLRGRGVADGRSGKHGDLLAVVRILPPKDISPRARELLEALDAELEQQPRASWPA